MKELRICPNCKEERWVQSTCSQRTRLCRRCFDGLRRKRTVEERPIWKHSDGYLEVHLPQDHSCWAMVSKSRGGIMVHRLVMAEYLGRCLEKWEVVHHINGIKDDNRIENLKITTQKGHQLSYRDGYAKGLKDGLELRDKELEKQIKLLQWQVKELGQQLQIKSDLFGV